MSALLRRLLILLASVLVSACASLFFSDHLISTDEIDATLQKRFPLYREKGNGIISVTLSAPSIRMLPGQNRIEFACDFAAASALGGVLKGHLQTTTGMRYDRTHRALFLQDAQLDAFEMNQTSTLSDAVKPIVNSLLNEFLKGYPIHRFEPNELRMAGVNLDIDSLRITDQGIRVKLKAAEK